ncbi:hypothetical protein [Longispora albida]|uniref:hypothetical protein n=1 Tax=Longispora albida TaxID=203523 RepID=UPI00039CEFC6|nr:hypothetical protein [Longispora albida]
MRQLRDLALGVTVLGTVVMGVYMLAAAVTADWRSGLTWPLATALLGPLLGAWLARRGLGRWTLTASLGLTTALFAGMNYSGASWLVNLKDLGVPHGLAAVGLGAVLPYAVAPLAKTRRPAALLLSGVWGAALLFAPIGMAYLQRYTGIEIYIWIGLAGFLASLVPVPFSSLGRRPRDPGSGSLFQWLGGLAILAIVSPIIQPQYPVKAAELTALYAVLAALVAYTVYASLRVAGPALAGVLVTGFVLVGTGYVLTRILAVTEYTKEISLPFAVAGLAGALAVAAALRLSVPARRWAAMIGPGLALLGLLGILDVGGKPRFAMWLLIAVAIGAGLSLGAGLASVNRSTALLTGGLLAVAVLAGSKLSQGLHVLAALTEGTASGMARHWVILCLLPLAAAAFIAYRQPRRA